MKLLLLKTFIPILFIIVLGITFLLTSILGCLWAPYKDIITEPNWFIIYSMFFGIWFSGYICNEYWEEYIK